MKIEKLMLRKIVYGNEQDVRQALGLLMHSAFDKKLLLKLAAEKRATGMMYQAIYWAKCIALGQLSEVRQNQIVKRLARNN